ncbi:unnamed protein product, partial [Cladocopium goreaui]
VSGRVSILTPTTASRARFHEQLWQCFVDQSWPDKELVVVETYTKKEKPSEVFTKLLKAKEKRLKYLGIQVDENDDLTVGAKRNMTVLMCSGQYCVNFDDDDLYATVYVERMVNELRQRSLVALTLSAWHNFFESNCRCGYSTPACWEPEDEEEYEGILYGYGFSYVYLRALALSFPYPNLGFAEDAPFMLKLREKMGAGRVGLKEDMEGLCLHIVHPSSSTPDPEIETMLTEDELNVPELQDVMEIYSQLHPISLIRGDSARQWPEASLFFGVAAVRWASGLAELDPPLPSSAAAYLFEGIDALRDGHLTPPELQGTLDIGQLFQSQEALRKVLHWDKATMQHHAKASSWIHDARPHWQQSGDDKVVKGPAEKSVKDSQKLPLVQSMLGAFLTASDAFDSMDQDHSDDASVMEFKETLAHFQPPISGFQAEQAFRNLDRDGNGKVSRAEFAVLNAAMPTGGSLNQNMQQLMSKAEEEFRKQASKWAGGMKQACIQLGTQVSFQHFQSAIRSFEPLLSAEVAQAVFNQMDSNHDGFIDENECHLSLKDFRKTMSSSNSLRNTFVAADQDNDHQLSEE